VLSFEGTIDGVEVVVDTDLSEVTTTSLRFPDLSLARDNIDLYGDSPYFSFRLSIASLGDADSRPDGEVVQAFGRSPDCEDGTLDDVVRFSMRVIAAGGSTDDDLTTGALTMLRQTTNEHIGTFDGAYRDGSPLRGCFTVFTDTAAIEQWRCATDGCSPQRETRRESRSLTRRARSPWALTCFSAFSAGISTNRLSDSSGRARKMVVWSTPR
jgi:hypothetical protein